MENQKEFIIFYDPENKKEVNHIMNWITLSIILFIIGFIWGAWEDKK